MRVEEWEAEGSVVRAVLLNRHLDGLASYDELTDFVEEKGPSA